MLNVCNVWNSIIIDTKIINITIKFIFVYHILTSLLKCFNFRIFCFEFMNFCTINKQVTIRSIIMQAQTKFCLTLLKLIEYIFSAVSVCSNPCLGPLPRIKIPFVLLSIFVDELLSTPKIITF